MDSIAQLGLLILLFLFLVLHLSILLKIIPYNLVWGGRLKSDKEMYRFEVVSIIVNSLFLIIILAQANLLAINIPKQITTYALWVMVVLFLLNTYGNAISKNKIEQRLFTPLTIILAIFSFILASSN